MERLKELIDRMVAAGPAFAQLSASEGHEIREGCLELIAQIGTAPEGSHPDEQKPRAETWHQERLNWANEVERLRAYIARLESTTSAAALRDESDYGAGDCVPTNQDTP